LDEPLTLVEALQREDMKQWKEVVDVVYNFLLDNETWELMKLPTRRHATAINGCSS